MEKQFMIITKYIAISQLYVCRPNGSTEKQSQITSHLSSFMNFLFQTTPSPAPAPSLPSLVEDTEFADIVNGI